MKTLSKLGFADLQAMLKYAQKQQEKLEKELGEDMANQPSLRYYWEEAVETLKKALHDNFAAAMGPAVEADRPTPAPLKPTPARGSRKK